MLKCELLQCSSLQISTIAKSQVVFQKTRQIFVNLCDRFPCSVKNIRQAMSCHKDLKISHGPSNVFESLNRFIFRLKVLSGRKQR